MLVAYVRQEMLRQGAVEANLLEANPQVENMSGDLSTIPSPPFLATVAYLLGRES